MGDRSNIEWTDATWTPIRARNRQTGMTGWFCTHASEGCRHCYAETMNRRLGARVDFKAQLQDQVEIFLDENILTQPLRWRRPRTVFVCSMTDLFGAFVTDEMIDRVFAVMAAAHWHDYQVLTKRSARMRAHVQRPQFGREVEIFTWPLPNVWLGISAEDQPNYDERWADLRETPAVVRFISAEPLLGPIGMQLPAADSADVFPDGVIVGGESGVGARPMHPEWARRIRDDCADAGVAFFFKQWGEWAPHRPQPGGDLGGDVGRGLVTAVHPSGRSHVEVFLASGGRNTEPGTRYMRRVGKRNAGRLLDGRTHDELPFTPIAARAA